MLKFFTVDVLTVTRRDFNESVVPKLRKMSFSDLIRLRQSLKHSVETKWRGHKLQYVVDEIRSQELTPKSKGKKWRKRKERIDDYFDEEEA